MILPPEGFFQQICFAGPFHRPEYHQVFNVSVEGPFDLILIDRCLSIVTGMTGGDIGFVRGPNPTLKIFIDPIKGANTLARTFKNVVNRRVKDAEIAFRTDQYIHYPKPYLHEFGHVLGLWDVGPEWNINGPLMMGGADLTSDEYNPWELLAWKRSLATI